MQHTACNISVAQGRAQRSDFGLFLEEMFESIKLHRYLPIRWRSDPLARWALSYSVRVMLENARRSRKLIPVWASSSKRSSHRDFACENTTIKAYDLSFILFHGKINDEWNCHRPWCPTNNGANPLQRSSVGTVAQKREKNYIALALTLDSSESWLSSLH